MVQGQAYEFMAIAEAQAHGKTDLADNISMRHVDSFRRTKTFSEIKPLLRRLNKNAQTRFPPS